MAEEKKNDTVIQLKNKDVARFNMGLSDTFTAGLLAVNLNEGTGTAVLVDGRHAMNALLSQNMSDQKKHQLNANEGYVIKITKYIEIEDQKKYSMVIRDFELMDKQFEPKSNYKYLIVKQKKFKKASKFINFEHDVANIGDNQ